MNKYVNVKNVYLACGIVVGLLSSACFSLSLYNELRK